MADSEEEDASNDERPSRGSQHQLFQTRGTYFGQLYPHPNDFLSTSISFPTRPTAPWMPHQFSPSLFQSPSSYQNMDTSHQNTSITQGRPSQPAHSTAMSINSVLHQYIPPTTLNCQPYSSFSTSDPFSTHLPQQRHPFSRPPFQYSYPYHAMTPYYPPGHNTYSLPAGPGPPGLLQGQPSNTSGPNYGAGNVVQLPHSGSIPAARPYIHPGGVRTGSNSYTGIQPNRQLPRGIQIGTQKPKDKSDAPPPFNVLPSQPISADNTPLIARSQPVARAVFGWIPLQGNLEQAQAAARAVQGATESSSNVETVQNQQQELNPASVNQPQQVLAQPTCIWNGFMEMEEIHENQRQMRQVRCSVLTNKADVIQKTQPQTWPLKMTMSIPYPKAMFSPIMVGMGVNRDTTNLKTVTFQFQEPPESVSMLRQLMVPDTSVQMFAIVHLKDCPISAMILTWSKGKKVFAGLIPLEQEKFVTVVKKVLIHRQRQQQEAGEQMIPNYPEPSSVEQPAVTSQQTQANKKIFDEAMRAGYVTVRINTVLLFGMAGAGKTSTMCLILGSPPPKERNSTPLAESAKKFHVRDVTKVKVKVNESSWKQITLDDMKQQTSEFLHRKYPNPPPELETKLKQLSDDCHSETSSVAVTVSSVNQDESDFSITELVNELQTLPSKDVISMEEEILSNDLVYVIDSGGQPQFHNLLPLFVQGVSTAVYILDLTYGPNDYPIINYFKKGELLGKEYRSNLTNAENFCCLIQSIKSYNNQCRLICIGTHQDKADKTAVQKNNSQLIELLPKHFRQSRNCIYKNVEKEFIFAINTLEIHHRQKLTEELQNVIWPPAGPFQECMFKEVKVPAWWYFLEIMLKTQFDKRKVLHFTECKKIANELSFHEEALIEALRFFHEHHIFHYYSFLPDVVFCDTQVLLDKVTELVEYATSPITDGSGMIFANEGVVTLETLSKFAKHYVKDLFEPKHLIKIFEKLLILTERDCSDSGQKRYIMPAVLNNLPESKLENYRLSSPIAPLLVCFKNRFIKCGVFCCLQVYLLRHGWKLSNEQKPKRNCMKYRVSSFLVTLINNRNYYLEIHVKPCFTNVRDSETNPKFCFEVKNLILEGIEQAQKKLGYDAVDDVVFGFFCPYKVTESQQELTCCQIALVGDMSMACEKYDEHCTKLQDEHKPWFQYVEDVWDSTTVEEGDESSFIRVPSFCRKRAKEGESSFFKAPPPKKQALTQEESRVNSFKQHMGVTDEQLDGECEDEDLDYFGRTIAGYMKYATALHLSQADIDAIDGDIRIAHSTKLKLAAAFKKWKSKCKADSLPATYRSLLKVALTLEDGNGAEEICRKCKRTCEAKGI